MSSTFHVVDGMHLSPEEFSKELQALGDVPRHQNEAKLLADRLRWLNERKVISLAEAQEICSNLGEIIHFLDFLVAVTTVTSQQRAEGE